VAAAAALGGYGIYEATKPPAKKVPIKIGFPAPFTGPVAADGAEMLHGATIAIEEINDAGGILGHQLEVIQGDTEDMEAGKVSSVAEKLLTRDMVDVMMTGYCSNTLVEVDIAEQYKVPYIFAGLSQLWEKMTKEKQYKYVWSTMVSYSPYRTELPYLVDERWRKQGNFVPKRNKFALINSENDYSTYIGNGIKENLLKMGWTITLDETVAFGTITEWRPLLEKIRADPPDLIVNTDYIPANEAAFLEQFLEDPTPSLVFMQYGPSLPEFIELTGAKSTGVIWYTVAAWISDPDLDPAGYAYEQKFEKRWGVKPGPIYAGFNYDMAYLYKQAVEKAGDPFNREAVANAIGNTDYKGIVGRYVMDPATRLTKSGEEYIPMATFQIWDGKQVLIGRNPLAKQDLREPPWVAKAREKYD